MTYRDELEAAVQRANQSERALAEEREKSLVKDQQIAFLQQQLANAQKGIAPVPSPHAITNATHAANPLARVVQRFLWAIAAFCALAILAAGSQRESEGVLLARMLGAVPIAAIAGQLTVTRPLKRYFASIALALVGGFFLIELFFAAVWPAL